MKIDFSFIQSLLREARDIFGEVYFLGDTNPSYSYHRELRLIPGGFLIRGTYEGLGAYQGAYSEYSIEFLRNETKYQQTHCFKPKSSDSWPADDFSILHKAEIKNNTVSFDNELHELTRPAFFAITLPSFLAQQIRHSGHLVDLQLDLIDVEQKKIKTLSVTTEAHGPSTLAFLIEPQSHEKTQGELQFDTQSLSLLSWKGPMGPLSFKDNRWQVSQGELRLKSKAKDSPKDR